MKLVLATHNSGKIKEFKRALNPYGIKLLTSSDFNIPEPEETGQSFHENALIKARVTYQHTQLPSLADDSGLEVNALGGRPGVYSADWAGPDKDFDAAMREVKDKLTGYDDWSARFTCVLAYVTSDKDHKYYEGQTTGKIVWPPRGKSGFGYDPCFEPDERQGYSFAELTLEEKQALSHRGRALQEFVNKELT